MYNKAAAVQLFTTNQVGLQKVFKGLLNESPDGVTSDDLDDSDFLTSLNSRYADFLSGEFDNIDTNKDGKISSKEFKRMVAVTSIQGYSYEQLMAMGSQVGLSASQKEMLDEVISNLQSVDKNHDGRVSQNEINSYMTNKEISEKISDLDGYKDSDISVFYSESDSESDDDDDDDLST